MYFSYQANLYFTRSFSIDLSSNITFLSRYLLNIYKTPDAHHICGIMLELCFSFPPSFLCKNMPLGAVFIHVVNIPLVLNINNTLDIYYDDRV